MVSESVFPENVGVGSLTLTVMEIVGESDKLRLKVELASLSVADSVGWVSEGDPDSEADPVKLRDNEGLREFLDILIENSSEGLSDSLIDKDPIDLDMESSADKDKVWVGSDKDFEKDMEPSSDRLKVPSTVPVGLPDQDIVREYVGLGEEVGVGATVAVAVIAFEVVSSTVCV